MTDFASQYQDIHARQEGYGVASVKLARYAEIMGLSIGYQRLIDYGCGKGTLGKAIARTGIDVCCYDPYVHEFSDRPRGRFDLLVSTDVLEHIPEPDLDAVLADMSSLSHKCFFVISTRYADTLLSNGQNAHCTVRPDEWWQARVGAHFEHVEKIPLTVPDTCSFITWPLATAARRRLRKVDGGSLKRRKIKKLKAATWPLFATLASTTKACLGRYASQGDLFGEVRGKSISVVGNARSLGAGNHGQEIDSHDLVVRFNKAPIFSVQSSGTRTDWIATGIALDDGFIKRRGVKRVLWLSPFRRELTPSMVRDRSLFLEPRQNHHRLTKLLGRRPSSGLILLDLLSISQCGRVDIYGFDFFKSRSLSGHATAETADHNFSAEREFVSHLCRRDDRFVLHTL
ncbi:MAG: glycosyltransferase family 29 protein [Mesorhizobium sp.]|nr:glycosyltransferase family 29 protein [Mesorhizobium sp.]MBL8580121.1 glycosyltransferase family 29 protein [Mesorhizobium sp.]